MTTQWLLTCFVGSAMPLSALLRLWDVIFYEVRRARPPTQTRTRPLTTTRAPRLRLAAQAHASFLFLAAAALLLRHRTALLATSDACDAYRLLMGLGSDLYDIDSLLQAAT